MILPGDGVVVEGRHVPVLTSADLDLSIRHSESPIPETSGGRHLKATRYHLPFSLRISSWPRNGNEP